MQIEFFGDTDIRSVALPTLIPTAILPKSNWRPPTILSNLKTIIAVDVETKDTRLTDRGPGFQYGEGEAVGISLYDGETALYLPFAHYGGDNMDKSTVIRFVRDQIGKASEVIMANAPYDLGWLDTLGIEVSCPVRDVLVAAALIDEELPSYSLDYLGKLFLGRGKDEDLLRKVAKLHGFDPKGDMWKLPARFVGPYAEEDTRLTLDLYHALKPKLSEMNLGRVWELECRMSKSCFRMTKRGVAVDLDYADQLNTRLKAEEIELRKRFTFDIFSPPQIGHWCENVLGLNVPRTEKGNMSVTKGFIQQVKHPELDALRKLRELTNLRTTYIEKNVLQDHYKGRIHCGFRQTSSDEGGTRSGRFSANNPNLQQVPKRSEIGKLIRKMYIPDTGGLWAKCDFSSQEPRLQVHYALLLGLPGAEQARATFVSGKKLYDFFEEATGLNYDLCKMLYLGVSYGMGITALAAWIEKDEDETQEVYDLFCEKAPFLKQLANAASEKAASKGFVHTILGRRSNFDFFYERFGDTPVKGYQQAREFYKAGRLRRGFTHKALNRIIQGSGGDQIKLSIALMEDAGLDTQLTVHDEINRTAANEKEALMQKEIMENSIPLLLPVLADMDLGPTWC